MQTLGVSWERFLPYMVHLRQSRSCYGKWCVTKNQRPPGFRKEEWTSRPPFMTSSVQQTLPGIYMQFYLRCVRAARRTFHGKGYQDRVQGLNHKATIYLSFCALYNSETVIYQDSSVIFVRALIVAIRGRSRLLNPTRTVISLSGTTQSWLTTSQ